MLRIAGIQPFSTIDWPGKLVCVAFLAGCPWRCPYCQNAALRSFDAGELGEEDLVTFLQTRRGLLDGVVFSGGEPLAQEGVLDAMVHVRELGFQVALHTCGAYPERLRTTLPELGWVGLDVKAPWEKYERITGLPGSGASAQASLDVLLASGVPMEARTTWHPALLSADDLRTIAYDLAERGVRSWAVQAYRHTGTRGELPDETVYPSDLPAELPALFEHFEFRRA